MAFHLKQDAHGVPCLAVSPRCIALLHKPFLTCYLRNQAAWKTVSVVSFTHRDRWGSRTAPVMVEFPHYTSPPPT